MTGNKRVLNIWTVFFNTTDYPNQHVARRFELDKPTPDHCVGTIQQVRAWIMADAIAKGTGAPYRMERDPNDEPTIVEVWV